MNVYTFRPHTRHFIENVLHGEFAEAERLLAEHAYIITDRNISKEMALHWLAIENELEGVRLLLRHGADPESESHSGDFVLADAASLGLDEVVRALLEAGASVNKRHRLNAETALHVAARHAPEPRIADLLLDAGAEIDARDHLTDTPLHGAASFGNRRFAARLLARGADPLAVDDCDETFVDRVTEDERPAWEALRESAMLQRRANEDCEPT